MRCLTIGGRGMRQILVACLTHSFAMAVAAEELEMKEDSGLNYQTSWVGNSFGGDGAWVQNFIIHMGVKDDGTVYTWSHWDEGGRRYGHYRDGEVVGNENLEPNSLKTIDAQGRQWEIVVEWVEPENNERDILPQHIERDGREVDFPGLHEPTAIATANDGTLMIACSGTSPRQQILFYDISDPDRPQLVRELGERGGIRAGTPGEVTPTKFWGIRGIGMDAQDNVYVGISEMGTVIRSLTLDGELNWEIYGLFFCDLAYPDPSNDARTIWGIQERFEMDYGRTEPGSEANWTHYTLDRQTWPDDPRGLTFVKQQGEHGLTSPQIVYLEGERFMFVGGMFASNFINIFRWDGEIAVPSGLIMQWDGPLYRTTLSWPPDRPEGTFIWRDLAGDGQYDASEYRPNTELVRPGPFWVDTAGDIWMPYGFFRYHFQGLDEHGNPIYSADAVTRMDVPEPVQQPARVWYDRQRDILVVAEQGQNMRHLDEVFIYHGYLAGNDDDPVRFTPGAGDKAGTMAAAGDFVFTGGWQERGRIWINRMSDGQEVGVLEPGPEVGGVEATGWIDLLTGIAAHRRDNGEYIILVEENYRGKSLMYRWRPEGQ